MTTNVQLRDGVPVREDIRDTMCGQKLRSSSCHWSSGPDRPLLLDTSRNHHILYLLRAM